MLIIRYILRLIVRVCEVTFFFLKFTGAYVPALVCLIIFFVQEKLHINPIRGSLGDTIEMAMIYISMIPVPFIFIGNIIRILKPDFSFLHQIGNITFNKDKY